VKRKFTPEERKNVEEAQRLRRDGQQLLGGDWFRVQPTQPELPLLVADPALEPVRLPVRVRRITSEREMAEVDAEIQAAIDAEDRDSGEGTRYD
jgi:hypothetical protein